MALLRRRRHPAGGARRSLLLAALVGLGLPSFLPSTLLVRAASSSAAAAPCARTSYQTPPPSPRRQQPRRRRPGDLPPTLASTLRPLSLAWVVPPRSGSRVRGGAAFWGSSDDGASSGDAGPVTRPSTGKDEPSSSSASRSKATVRIASVAAVALLSVLLAKLDYAALKSSAATLFDRKKFRVALLQTLNDVASKGNRGLLLYAFGFVWWEVCGLPTSVVETAAGMAFGYKRGLLGSFAGKTCGSIVAFLLGRTLLAEAAGRRMEGVKAFGSIERGMARNPVWGTMVVRYSPFPQFLKNFSLSVTRSVKFPLFLLAIFVHGFPFSMLWAALGEDSARRLRASDAGEVMAANKVLNGLLVFVTVFGFVVSPAVTGWWLADNMRREED
ncbi:hypothetical protein ACHAWF_001349 [Thalassiosira exigua]